MNIILRDLIARYSIDIPTKILDWIPKNKLCRDNFIYNDAVVAYYEKIYNKVFRPLRDENILDGPIENIDFDRIAKCLDPKAIYLLEKYPNKIDWDILSKNPAAIHLLEKNPNKINWNYLSRNPDAVHLLEKHLDKINWDWLSRNLNAIHLLEKNIDKIRWTSLSTNPAAIHLLKNNQDNIYWYYLSFNPAIFELDKQAYKITINLFMDHLNQL
jgi:hypothetical protein